MSSSLANNPKTPMDRTVIETYIPHRAPFLLLDRITEYLVGEFLTAEHDVVANDPILTGHFPGNPVLPGVLMVESMAQASAVLGRLTRLECSNCLLTEISEARFRRQVVPGETLRMTVKITRARQSFFWFECEASVKGEIAVNAKISARLL